MSAVVRAAKIRPVGSARDLARASFFGGEVTCLAVRGNVATMNIVDDVDGFGLMTIEVTDSGASDIVEVGLTQFSSYTGRLFAAG